MDVQSTREEAIRGKECVVSKQGQSRSEAIRTRNDQWQLAATARGRDQVCYLSVVTIVSVVRYIYIWQFSQWSDNNDKNKI